MAQEFYIKCDGEGCNARVQTQQPGNLPTGWVVVNFAKLDVQSGQTKPQAEVFCGWRCAHKFIRGHIRKEDLNE